MITNNIFHYFVTTTASIMARSHWRFSRVSDYLGSEAIYLDIFTSAIFPRDYYIYFMFVYKNHSLEWVQHPFESERFFLTSENCWKIANVNSTTEYTSIH